VKLTRFILVQELQMIVYTVYSIKFSYHGDGLLLLITRVPFSNIC
jgi:hypothetical protein